MSYPTTRPMVRFYRRMVPVRARDLIRDIVLNGDTTENPRTVSHFDDKAVVVIAPDVSDVVAGIGGTLSLHAAAGANITVVVTATDASGSGLTSRRASESASDRDDDTRRYGKIKEPTARAACQALGIEDLVFLNRLDNALPPSASIMDECFHILKQRAPSVIYHPSLLDIRDECRHANLLLARCLRDRAVASNTRLRSYEAWTPLIANRLVDITDTMPSKLAALAHFASDSAADLARVSAGLNAYRSLHHLQGVGYAEGLQETSIRQLLASAKEENLLPVDLDVHSRHP